MLGDDFVPLKCRKCRKVAIKLIKEQVPMVILRVYPEGVCRDCKRKAIKSFRGLLR